MGGDEPEKQWGGVSMTMSHAHLYPGMVVWLLRDFGELENFTNLLVRKTPLVANGKVH